MDGAEADRGEGAPGRRQEGPQPEEWVWPAHPCSHLWPADPGEPGFCFSPGALLGPAAAVTAAGLCLQGLPVPPALGRRHD